MQSAGIVSSVDAGGITLSVQSAGIVSSVDAGGITLSVQSAGIASSVDTGGITLSVQSVGIVSSVDAGGITQSVQSVGISSVHSPAILFVSGPSKFGSALSAHSARVGFTVDSPPLLVDSEHTDDEDSEMAWCVVWRVELSMGSARLVDRRSVDSGLVMLVDSAELTLSVDSVLTDGGGDACLLVLVDSTSLVVISFAEGHSEL